MDLAINGHHFVDIVVVNLVRNGKRYLIAERDLGFQNPCSQDRGGMLGKGLWRIGIEQHDSTAIESTL